MSEQAKPKMAALAGLGRIKPNPPAPPAAREDAPLPAPVRAVAEAHGFVDREPPVAQRNRAKPKAEPMRLFTMRVAVRDANAFTEWCDRNRVTYREAFAMIVRQLEEAGE